MRIPFRRYSCTLLAAAALLFGAGWCSGRRALGRETIADTLAARARADAADLARARDSAAYALYRATADARIGGLEARAHQLQRQADIHATADRAQDSALTVAASAADSVPILVSQRDDARLAYRFATLRGDSLQAAGDSLHTLIAQGDTLLEVTRRSGAAREAALLSSIAAINVELAREKDRGKLFGLVKIPGWVQFGAGVAVQHRRYFVF